MRKWPVVDIIAGTVNVRREAVVLIPLIALLCGCSFRSDDDAEKLDSTYTTIPDTSTLQPQPSLEEFINALPLDSSYMVRDLESEEILHAEDRDGILVLTRARQVLDTFSTHAAGGGMYGHVIENFDSTFLVFEGMFRGMSGTAYRQILCVNEGRFKLLMDFMCETHRIPEQSGDGYFLETRLHRNPYRITGVERYRCRGCSPEDRGNWSDPFTLHFDDSAKVFYSMMVPLQNVPIRRSDREIIGRFPAIVFKGETEVYIEGQWYGLGRGVADTSASAYEQQIQWVKGLTPKITSGSRIQGDTLYPLYRVR